MIDKSHQDDLDWDNLSNPVPLDLIDPEFPAQADPAATSLPGARSEILAREESEALAQAHDATLEMPQRANPSAPVETLNAPTLEMAARGPVSGGEGAFGSAWREPDRTGNPEDEFSRLRSKMEAEAEAERRAKQEAEKEEAAQRERLEQWMANARARLLKADADLTGPSARIRKEHSPSLYRLAEMQKTLIAQGEDTLAQSPNGTVFSEAPRKAAEPPPDPMATLSVPADQFLTLDAPAQPTARGQTAQPYPSGEIRLDRIPAPMTREQALTRKVAQLRKVAEASGEAAPVALRGGLPERSALHFAIAAVVIVAIGVLGLGLFAATQAGLFDGLENRVPFLRPKMSPQQLARPSAKPAASAAPARPASNVTVTQPAVVPVAHPVPSAQAATAVTAAKAVKAAQNPDAPARAKKAAPPAQAAAPAAAKAPPKASNLAEIILRASVQAAANIDADNLQELYNRYALGFPGLSGEVLIGLTVDPGGRVLEGSIVSSSTGVDAFDQELLRRVLDWRLRAFPDSRPRFITIPFLFPLQEH
ncbi:MAG TPA: TonB family protein [Fibrobacteria bacterium]|nr:TonB family protein [Fibrobacteria bacterium]